MSASAIVIPACLIFCGFLMLIGKASFEDFKAGAAVGMKSAFSLLPTLVALVCALMMLEKSGAVALVARLLSPVLTSLGIPAELIPLALTRPLSGAASTAAFSSLLESAGADSPAALCGAVMMGSSDTLLYVMSVYFSPTHVKSAPRALAIGGASCVLCLFVSALLVRIFLT